MSWRIGVLAVLVVAAGCGGVGPGDPRVGQFNGTFSGCGPIGNASIQVIESGIAYIDTDLNDYFALQSGYESLGGFSPQMSFKAVRTQSVYSLAYDVEATLSDDHQFVTGMFTAAWTQKGYPPEAPRECRLSLKRVYWDPLAVDSRASEFTCASVMYQMSLPGSGGVSINDTSATAPIPSCFGGPVRAVRFRPPAKGRYDVTASTGQGVEGYYPVAAFSSCTGEELACGSFEVILQLRQFQDVLLVSGGPYEASLEVSFQEY
jgi:hypothetical protein